MGGNGDHQYMNGVCQLCGTSETQEFQRTLGVELSRSRLLISRGQLAKGIRQCPSIATSKSSAPTPPPTVMLRYGDTQLLRQARINLCNGGAWSPHHFTEVVDHLVNDLLVLPGVHRRGLPLIPSDEQHLRGMEHTALLGRSSLSPIAYERALQCIQIAELMDAPSPSWHVVSSSSSASTSLGDVFHPSMPTRALERSVRAKVRERVWSQLAENQKKASHDLTSKVLSSVAGVSPSVAPLSIGTNAPSKVATAATATQVTVPYLGNSLSTGLGLPIDIIGYEDDGVARDWKLNERVFREELDAYVLPQILAEASYATISGGQHIQTRYAPLDDSLLVAYHQHTPLTRESEYNWNDFLCPKMNFSTWQSSPAIVRNTPPSTMYNWSNSHSGVISRHVKLLYPCDQSLMGCTRITSGQRSLISTWIEKDSHLLTLDADTIVPSFGSSNIVAGSFAAMEEERKKKLDEALLTSSEVSSGTKVEKKDNNNDASHRNKQLVLSHRYNDDTRITIHGTLASRDIGISYLNATGLLTTMCHDGSIRMSYPRSSPLGKRGIRTSVVSSISLPSTTSTSDANLYMVGRSNEEWRRVHVDGTVERHMTDGSTIWLYSNADVARQYAPINGIPSPIVRTNSNGQRVAMYANGQQLGQDDISVARLLDAETQARITSRADLVEYTQYADGSSLVQHADGTRIYIDIIKAASQQTTSSGKPLASSSSLGSQGGQRITIECPDFPPVIISHEDKFTLGNDDHDDDVNSKHIAQVQRQHIIDIQMNHHDGTIMNMRLNEYARIIKPIAGQLIISGVGGTIIYVPNDAIPNGTQLPSSLLVGEIDKNHLPQSCYIIDINEGRMSTVDREENTFVTTISGQAGALLGRHKGIQSGVDRDMIPAKFYPPPENPMPPRLFIIRADATGYELLTKRDIERYIHMASCDPLAPLSILPSEYVSSSSSSTSNGSTTSTDAPISHKFLQTLHAPSSYIRQPVVPNVIKATPNGQARSLSTPTSFVMYRHVIEYPVVSQSDINTVIQCRDQYRIWKANTLRHDQEADVEDVRSDYQRHQEQLLAGELMAERQRRAAIRHADVHREAAHERIVLDGVQHIGNGDIPLSSVTSVTTGGGLTRGIGGMNHSIAPPLLPSQVTTSSVATPHPAAPTVTTFFHAKEDTPVPKQPRAYGAPESIPPATSVAGSTPYFGHSTFQKRYEMATLVKELRDRAYASGGDMSVDTLLHDLCHWGAALSTLLLAASESNSNDVNDRIRPSIPDARLRARVPFTFRVEPFSSALHANALIREAAAKFITILGIERAPKVIQLSSPFPLDANISGKAAKIQSNVTDASSSSMSMATSPTHHHTDDRWIVSDDVLLSEGLSTLQLELEKLHAGVTSLHGWYGAPSVLREEKDNLTRTSAMSRSTQELHHSINPNFTVHYSGNITASLRGTSKDVVGMVNHDDSDDDESKQQDNDVMQPSPPSQPRIIPNDDHALEQRLRATLHGRPVVHASHGNSFAPRPLPPPGSSRATIPLPLQHQLQLQQQQSKNDASQMLSLRPLQPLAESATPTTLLTSGIGRVAGAGIAPSTRSISAQPIEPRVPSHSNAAISSSTTASGVSSVGGRALRQTASHGSFRRPSAEKKRARSLTATPLLHMVPATPVGNLSQSSSRASIGGGGAIRSMTAATVAANITLKPEMIDFGNVAKGGTYRVTCVLTNISRDTCRFTVRQPSSDTLIHLRVLYRPGLIAPGLVRRLELELFAGQPGHYSEQIAIETDKVNYLSCFSPIHLKCICPFK
jgi:hypothetical protein